MFQPKLKGSKTIGGWLIIYVIFVLYSVATSSSSLNHLNSETTYEQVVPECTILIKPSGERETECHDKITTIVEEKPEGIELWTINILTGLVIIFAFYCLILIFGKKKKAIKWNIYYLWSVLIVNLLSVFIYAFIEFGEIFSAVLLSSFAIIFPIIWILYWKKSKRVKDTFERS